MLLPLKITTLLLGNVFSTKNHSWLLAQQQDFWYNCVNVEESSTDGKFSKQKTFKNLEKLAKTTWQEIAERAKIFLEDKKEPDEESRTRRAGRMEKDKTNEVRPIERKDF